MPGASVLFLLKHPIELPEADRILYGRPALFRLYQVPTMIYFLFGPEHFPPLSIITYFRPLKACRNLSHTGYAQRKRNS